MKKLSITCMRFISKFIKKDKKLITVIFRGYSGSNLSPIIEKLSDSKYNKYKIKIIHDGKIYSDFKDGKISKHSFYKKILEKYKYVMKSKLIITTHGFYRLRNDNIMLNLWHGVPLKSMSLMNKSKSDEVGFIEDDYFLSTSEFFNTVMNACIGIRAEQYYIAGYPRNDYLFNEDGVRNLELLTNMKIGKKVILYMPTYRDLNTKQSKRHNRINNFFGFEQFDFVEFDDFLEKNNLLFILKLHPNEERLFIDRYLKFNSKNIILIKSKDLEIHKMDFYKIVNAANILITDYSSIYFDYLLLDRPIIFTPVDFEEYKENRGFLLEPYDFWAPGPKCLGQEQLQKEILNCLNNLEYYKKERETIKNIVHKYQDNKSTKRVMDLIDKIMEENN